ncbi:hypothetical protein HMPREF2948_00190 [Haemophilus sp. HMSC073C03]|jgi:hypothetical protein|uniref:Holin n=1 Tax=Myoviridae sp. ctniE2 TaxID=2825172 RepID=A0A8S5PJ04_9CAUD|nr:hypothetical protein [Haemophilus sp. HMSC073C03]OFQ20902.1 hypothetical protein HMPREF2948_00190 [Haemophilus sp. HMSC073C03]DAE06377.1 MAG TPA: hypothetical protein [Myoviridae sp. ctniE2]DAJ35036.1 MAG TPA: hypothetical protein [Caudoviricetes sp.]
MEVHINGMMIFNGLVSVAVFFIGVWFKKLDSEFKSLHDEVKEVKRDYVSKEVAGITNQSILDKLGAISEQLQSITKKLDNKADK